MLSHWLSSDDVVLRCERHVSQSISSCREDGVPDRWCDADDACLSRTCGGQILAVQQDDLDLRGIAEPRNPVLGKSRIFDSAIGEEDPFEESASYALNERTLHLVAKTVGIHDGAAFPGLDGAPDLNLLRRWID